MMKTCYACFKVYEANDSCPFCGFIESAEKRNSNCLMLGTILDNRFVIGKILGFGGFGITYAGYDKVLSRIVAIKEYLPNEFSTRMPEKTYVTVYSGSKENQFRDGKERFLREAKSLAKLQSQEGIVHIFNCFEENGTAYIIMELLVGETLKQRLESVGKYSFDEALEIIIPVLDALEIVHNHGIIHRDIAPDNIFITNDGNVKLIDFGAARYATTSYSKSLSVILKPGYSPEEQYRSRGEQGPWTDIYSVAATMYRMITGIIPPDALERAVKDDLLPPLKCKVKIRRSKQNALLNALNIPIKGRPQSALEFKESLESNRVKRKRIKASKIDIGKWPLKAKLTVSFSSIVLCIFITLLATGHINFSIAAWGSLFMAESDVRVPRLTNMEYSEALNTAEDAGISLILLRYEYSNDIREGRIISQSEERGTIVRRGSEIEVVVSAGAQPVNIPNVVALMDFEALPLLNNLNLKITIEEIESTEAPGLVLSQSLNEGEVSRYGEPITLIISKGMDYDESKIIIVPNILELNYNDAKLKLNNQGIYIRTINLMYDDYILKDAIISQSVLEGVEVNGNSVIEVVVSKGIEPVIVPDLIGLTLETADREISRNRLNYESSEMETWLFPDGTVMEQSIEADTEVDKFSTINIVIAQMPTIIITPSIGCLLGGDEVRQNYNQYISLSNYEGIEIEVDESSVQFDRVGTYQLRYLIVNEETREILHEQSTNITVSSPTLTENYRGGTFSFAVGSNPAASRATMSRNMLVSSRLYGTISWAHDRFTIEVDDSRVNYNAAGSYNITYRLIDPFGNVCDTRGGTINIGNSYSWWD